MSAKKCGDAGRNCGVGQHKELLVMRRQHELIQEHHNVRENQRDVYDRIASGGIVVLERDEHESQAA
jgi:hypothetical protein